MKSYLNLIELSFKYPKPRWFYGWIAVAKPKLQCMLIPFKVQISTEE
jgi:hypothetical protein